MVRMWIDTDVGSDVDDAIALWVAVAHPGIELVGVSTVFGDSALRARIATEVLRRAGVSSIPVLAGACDPRPPGARAVMFGNEGVGLLDGRASGPAPSSMTVAELRAAVEAAAPDVVVAIGPLTNIARLVEAGYRPPRLVLMGGALDPVEHRGRSVRAEWNFRCDGRAAGAVLAAVPSLVVPLDVTLHTGMTADDVAALTAAAPGLAGAVAAWIDLVVSRGTPPAEPSVYLHDPLAVLVAAGEALVATEERRLAVLADGAIVEGPEHPAHTVAVDVDGRRVVDRVLELLV